MDNYPFYTNLPFLAAFLESVDGENFFSDLDDKKKSAVLSHSDEFNSKEEVERYLYDLDHPDSIH